MFMNNQHLEAAKIGYRYLSPEDKLKVLKLWVNKSIDIRCKQALSEKAVHPKLESLIQNIETFAYSRCRNLIKGTLEYAKVHARYCFYCKCLLSFNKVNPLQHTDSTVDHFFPVGHSHRSSKIHVISCHACNSWKSGQSPELLLQKIADNKKDLPKGWNKETYRRIQTVLKHLAYGIHMNGYFILKRKERI